MHDHIPEPDGEHEDEHFVHMHIEFDISSILDKPEDYEVKLGDVLGQIHMHIHGVPEQAAADALTMLAIQLTTRNIMKKMMGGFTEGAPDIGKEKAAEILARASIIREIKGYKIPAGFLVNTTIPDDASSLMGDQG